jgi:transcriptional regulator with XRE-family HTH domain
MTSNLREKLQKKTYRDPFVASQIVIALPFQIRALREQRGWTQAQLAEKAGMLQPRISAMERPGGSKFNLETVLRIAAALDVAFVGRFASFGELAEWAEHFSPDTFTVPTFEDDPAFHEGVAASTVPSNGDTDSKTSTGNMTLTFRVNTTYQKDAATKQQLELPFLKLFRVADGGNTNDATVSAQLILRQDLLVA